MVTAPERNKQAAHMLNFDHMGAGTLGANEDTEKRIEEIEVTQEALRDSIEQARSLAAKADKLLKRHKKALKVKDPV